MPNRTHPHAPDAVYAEVDINPYHRVQQVCLDDFELLGKKASKLRARRNYAVDELMRRKVSVAASPAGRRVAASRVGARGRRR